MTPISTTERVAGLCASRALPSTAPSRRGSLLSAVLRFGLKKGAHLEGEVDSAIDEVLAPPTELSDYLERNRIVWDEWAAKSAVSAAKAWRADELRWGLWNTPESHLQLLRGLEPGANVIELGCGTAEVSAWLRRSGMHPVGVDLSLQQLRTAEHLQHAFGISFPLIQANAEDVPFDENSFDAAISEYGASTWCNPRRWLPEAHRLLRPDGLLIFFTNAAILMTCTPPDGGPVGESLVRDYFSSYRVEFEEHAGVEFHLPHGHWVRLLRATGFVVENLVELRPAPRAKPRYEFVAFDWARRWPSEEIWIARKVSNPASTEP